ncbi:hypothetical protein OKW96_00160 [Sphingobacterium sp. KU25419]|nr:hypothetical protein OKW96_00160 [Sphingobacterium sp. KU25419]
MQEWADLNCPIDESITKDSLLMLKGQIKMDKNRWAGFYKNYQDILKKEPKKEVLPLAIKILQLLRCNIWK